MLFEGKYQILDLWILNCDMPSGGLRYLQLKPAEQATATGINVLLN